MADNHSGNHFRRSSAKSISDTVYQENGSHSERMPLRDCKNAPMADKNDTAYPNRNGNKVHQTNNGEDLLRSMFEENPFNWVLAKLRPDLCWMILIMYTPNILRRLINNRIKKFASSLKKNKLNTEVKVSNNCQVINALFSTGAQKTCIRQKHFRNLFSQGVHSKRQAQERRNLELSPLEKQQCFPYLRLDFLHATCLSYNAERRQLFWSDQNAHWRTANMVLNKDVTLNPISNAVVTINVKSQDQARPSRGLVQQ